MSARRSALTATLRQLRLVPVIVIDDPSNAPALADALMEGGLPCAEVTFRTERAEEALKRMVESRPDMTVGAGTILTMRQAAAARSAGASFIVAPGFNRSVVDYCLEHDMPVYPGVCTPTEIEAVMSAGLTEMKFFPAEALGGTGYLKAVSAPYRDVYFMPTGGITAANVRGYLALPNVIACGGSWMVSAEHIGSGNFTAIREAVLTAMQTVREP